MNRNLLLIFLLLSLLLPCALPLFAGQTPAGQTSPAFPKYHRKEFAVPMRDGIHLHTDVFAPENIAGPLPIILVRTPYNSDEWGIGPNFQYFKTMAEDGYIFVIQDARGRFKSEGTFVMMRSPRHSTRAIIQKAANSKAIRPKATEQEASAPKMTDPKADDTKNIDEGTDAYDTIAWLVRNVPNNNGRVGMLGVSYDGWLAAMALTVPHPALRAVSPQAPPADMFLGDDFHHNGAFRLSYGFEYAAMMETDKSQNFTFDFDRYDTYDWYLRLGPLANANAKYLHGKLPTWNDFVAHPNYDTFWQQQAAAPIIQQMSPTVPTLLVAGWWDQEDFDGPLKIYAALQKAEIQTRTQKKKFAADNSVRAENDNQLKDNQKSGHNYLVVGPWNHGGWGHGDGRRLGLIDFGSDTAAYFRDKVQAPWFAHYLKDRPLVSQSGALVFESGSNQWVGYDQWPPTKDIQPLTLYFRADGLLSIQPPGSRVKDATPSLNTKRDPKEDGRNLTSNAQGAADSYLSDPSHPVPYRPRPIEATYFPKGSGWYTWLLEDQRFVSDRSDVLSWETAPLSVDVALAGNIVAHLFASTSGTDCDWIVKLIDVYPEKAALSDTNAQSSRNEKRDKVASKEQIDRTKETNAIIDPITTNPKMAGYQLMVANEVLRGRFRHSFEKPEAIVPNRVETYTVDLHSQAYRFRKGHRIMVQVQSSWFPLIDRNPQTFVSNIFAARPEDFHTATQRVFRAPRYPSHITISVTNN